jgi:hypothetical protein
MAERQQKLQADLIEQRAQFSANAVEQAAKTEQEIEAERQKNAVKVKTSEKTTDQE